MSPITRDIIRNRNDIPPSYNWSKIAVKDCVGCDK